MKTKLLTRMMAVTVGAAAALAGATACSASTPTPTTTSSDGTVWPQLGTFSFGVNPGSIPNLTVFAAAAMGIFDKYGIHPDLINSTSTDLTLRLLSTGQMDFGATTITTPIVAYATNQVPLQYVTSVVSKTAGAIVCRDSAGIPDGFEKGFPALVGHSVGIYSTIDPALRTVYAGLDDLGIDHNKVNFQFIAGTGAMIAALQGGAIDCGWLNYPGPSEIGPGYVTVLDQGKTGQYPAIADVTGQLLATCTKAFADKNPAVLKAVQAAIKETVGILSDPANSTEVAQAVTDDFPGTDVSDLADQIAGVAPTFVGAGPITQDQFDGALAAYNKYAPLVGLEPDHVDAKYSDWVYQPQLQ